MAAATYFFAMNKNMKNYGRQRSKQIDRRPRDIADTAVVSGCGDGAQGRADNRPQGCGDDKQHRV